MLLVEVGDGDEAFMQRLSTTTGLEASKDMAIIQLQKARADSIESHARCDGSSQSNQRVGKAGQQCLHGLGRHVVCPVNDTNAGQPKVCQFDMALA